MKLSKSLCLCLSSAVFAVIFAVNIAAQERSRFVETAADQIYPQLYRQDLPPNSTTVIRRPSVSLPTNTARHSTLTNDIVIKDARIYQPLVKKTAASQPTNPIPGNYVSKGFYSAVFNQRLVQAIQMRIGIPYRYGSTGPTSYDCSGLVWSVFQDAGFSFERTSARTLWQTSETVEGDDRYKLGTLVFFNGLAHIGIVADADGFYHASSSHGVTYSRFDGYWANRIVGFRRMNMETPQIAKVQKAKPHQTL